MAFNKNPLQAGNDRDIIDYSQDLEDRVGNVVDELIDVFYPVGTIYESTNSRNPSTFMGGTWEEYGKGRVTVGLDTTQTEFNTIDKTGGAKTHKLTNEELPSFDIADSGIRLARFQFGSGGDRFAITSTGPGYPIVRYVSPGNDEPHNNLQPYITVYRFRRTA